MPRNFPFFVFFPFLNGFQFHGDQRMNKRDLVLRFLIVEILVVVLFAASATSEALQAFKVVSSGGTVVTAVNVDIYADPGCTQVLTQLVWGNLAPGSNNTQTIYIKNTGNVPELLSIATNAWNPANASTVLTLTWDLGTATVLAASTSTPTTLTLAVASNPGSLTTFSFNVTITGMQQ